MEEIRIIALCFGGLFTFAFGLAWFLPLFAVAQEDSKKGDDPFVILDLILVLLDCIPVFWLFRAISNTPSAAKTARETWQKEPSIRAMFWLSCGSLIATIGFYLLPS